MVHPLIIIRILSTILIICTISILCCVPVAYIYNEPLYPLLYSAFITGVIGFFFRIYCRKVTMADVSARDAYISVTLAWLLFSLSGSLPFIIGGSIPSFADAFFESVSGITTTGASILPDIEILPKSMLFWRALTHWIGGLGIILLVIIILPSLKITAQQLMSLESSLKEKILPSTKSIGYRLLFIYLSLTIAETILLYLGDMDLFDSVCHSFSTIATGGFSTKNDSIAGFSKYTQIVITVFMFLSGVSFLLFYYMVKRKFYKILHNEEFWFYVTVVLIATILVSFTILPYYHNSISEAIEAGLFQVIAIITTTGFATVDFVYWPNTAIIILFLLLFTGACTGSTSGGIKMARHLVVIKNINFVFKRLHHPKLISHIMLNGKVLTEKANLSTLSFIILFLGIFLIGALVFVLIGIEPITAISTSISMLGCVGPALGTAGPMMGFAHFPVIAKLFCSILMIIGRLELMTVFAIFTKSFWRL